MNLSWSLIPRGVQDSSTQLSDSFGSLLAASLDFLSVPKPASVVRSANSPWGSHQSREPRNWGSNSCPLTLLCLWTAKAPNSEALAPLANRCRPSCPWASGGEHWGSFYSEKLPSASQLQSIIECSSKTDSRTFSMTKGWSVSFHAKLPSILHGSVRKSTRCACCYPSGALPGGLKKVLQLH